MLVIATEQQNYIPYRQSSVEKVKYSQYDDRHNFSKNTKINIVNC